MTKIGSNGEKNFRKPKYNTIYNIQYTIYNIQNLYFASVSPVYIREPHRKTFFLINDLVMVEMWENVF